MDCSSIEIESLIHHRLLLRSIIFHASATYFASFSHCARPLNSFDYDHLLTLRRPFHPKIHHHRRLATFLMESHDFDWPNSRPRDHFRTDCHDSDLRHSRNHFLSPRHSRSCCICDQALPSMTFCSLSNGGIIAVIDNVTG
jgi:hypothetical protein